MAWDRQTLVSFVHRAARVVYFGLFAFWIKGEMAGEKKSARGANAPWLGLGLLIKNTPLPRLQIRRAGAFDNLVNLLGGKVVFFRQLLVVLAVKFRPNLPVALVQLAACVFGEIDNLPAPVVGDVARELLADLDGGWAADLRNVRQQAGAGLVFQIGNQLGDAAVCHVVSFRFLQRCFKNVLINNILSSFRLPENAPRSGGGLGRRKKGGV